VILLGRACPDKKEPPWQAVLCMHAEATAYQAGHHMQLLDMPDNLLALSICVN